MHKSALVGGPTTFDMLANPASSLVLSGSQSDALASHLCNVVDSVPQDGISAAILEHVSCMTGDAPWLQLVWSEAISAASLPPLY